MIRNLFSPLINNSITFYDHNEGLNILFINETFENKLKIITNYLYKIINREINWYEIFKQNKIKEDYKNKYKSQVIYIKSFINNEYEEDLLYIFFLFN